MNKKKMWVIFAIVLLSMMALTVVVTSSGQADAASLYLVEYPVPGSPLNVAAESPGHVWFTLPDQDAIGRLVVTSTVEYQVITYSIPTVGGEPYDLVYVGGIVWFTERMGNKIGRLDPSTGTVDEFPVPTSNSAPTGIDVAPNGQVWFVERGGNNLARLVMTSTVDYRVDEFALPVPSGQLQDVDVQHDNMIWFTAPGLDRLYSFQPSKWPGQAFYFVPASGSTPWGVVVDNDGWPWITAYDTDLVGRYRPQTIGDWTWYSLKSSDAGPTGIAFDMADGLNRIWFVEKDSGRVGRLDTIPLQGTKSGLWEWPLPSSNSQPEGITVDSAGHAWIAETGANKIAEWRSPYFFSVYLPIVSVSSQ
jgi:virginiamycin B lyase